MPVVRTVVMSLVIDHHRSFGDLVACTKRLRRCDLHSSPMTRGDTGEYLSDVRDSVTQ